MMTNQEVRDTMRQMLADWNAATEEQRAEALRLAAAQADAVGRCASCRHDRTGARAIRGADTCASRDRAGRPWYVATTSEQICGGWEAR